MSDQDTPETFTHPVSSRLGRSPYPPPPPIPASPSRSRSALPQPGDEVYTSSRWNENPDKEKETGRDKERRPRATYPSNMSNSRLAVPHPPTPPPHRSTSSPKRSYAPSNNRSSHHPQSSQPHSFASSSRRYPRAAVSGSDYDRSLPVKTLTSTATSTSIDGSHPESLNMSQGTSVTLPSGLAASVTKHGTNSSSGRTLFDPMGGRANSSREPGPTRSGASVGSSSRRSHDRAAGSSGSTPIGGYGNHALPNQTISMSPSGSFAPGMTNVGSSSEQPRQLFDPRLHDPVRFAQRSRNGAPSVTSNSTGTSHPSVSSKTASTTLTSIHEPSGDRERERRKRREGSERKAKSRNGDRDETKSRSSEGSESLKDRQRGKGGDTGVLGTLREQYKAIQALELNLQDIHRRMGRDEVVLLGSGVHLGAKMGDEGWVELISRHMKLAHAHHDFLTASLDARLPASLHSLPVKYNIPARLWQNSFHLLIERMRSTWLAPSSSTSRDLATISDTLASASTSSARALEHLTDYILDAYSFYTTLLDEQVLQSFRSAWIEALGDLARYRMAVANMVGSTAASSGAGTTSASSRLGEESDRMARIDDEEEEAQMVPSGNSIGKEVADAWDVEDRETWRTTARDWYALGVGEKPGEGRLHHRLALLSRDVKGEEERALYHFSKSLITNNDFPASRESILPLFDTALQNKRFHPDATASELFVLLHGMIFTKIQLDDFDDIFARFFERLEEDRLGTRPVPSLEWLMMGIINLSACLQYGAEDGLLRRAAAEDIVRKGGKGEDREGSTVMPHAIMVHSGQGKREGPPEGVTGPESDEGSDGLTKDNLDAISSEGEVRQLGTHTVSAEDEESLPLPFRHALRLSFSILSFCLVHPIRKDSSLKSIVNPYIPIFLTFLSTIAKQPLALALVERAVPWEALVSFLNSIPRKVEVKQTVPPKLSGGGPLPEDWCLRGMEWVGRRVYERGFWKQRSNSPTIRDQNDRWSTAVEGPRSGQVVQSEMDVLQFEVESLTMVDSFQEGIVEGEGDGADALDLSLKRWRRIAWSLGVFVRHVPGLEFDRSALSSLSGATSSVGSNVSQAGRKVRIIPRGALQRKLEAWAEERRIQAELVQARLAREEETRLAAWEGSGFDEEEDEEESDPDDEEDPELRALKTQRRQLRAILQETRRNVKPRRSRVANSRAHVRSGAHLSHRSFKTTADLPPVLPGYTVLVFDTNVLLSSLAVFATVVESARWTTMVPLPVITELDGLTKQPPPLGLQANEALAYVTSHIRSHARTLKVQTSRGNYLSDLTIRSEDLSFSFSSDAGLDRARNMDDLILRACSFQEEHFVDRTGILGVSGNRHSNDINDDNDGEGTADRQTEEARKAFAVKVVLMTFDRNLRLRAKAQGIQAVDEKSMLRILGLGRNGKPLAEP
ncbi:Nonsense-mediated mRNA decay protein [Phaffia rhodozyma]|uniref:Nonsense-mediated mRNA decay protein n=1 Tax=Phaffia rhodozyma TaxID=264483 RepID=A0A0F7SFP2_PHARH|nr:Nonsense-mediated mRNA decay protein [Phaffia rhodozyma]